MIKKSYSTNNSGGDSENVFWVTMADLLLGLAIIFITLFVLAMTGFSQNKLEEHKVQAQVAQELSQKLKQEKIDAQVDNLTGQVKIADSALFEINSYTLSAEGKAFLDKFVPVYINTVFSKPEIKDKVVNIVIQGHTDSQSFAGITSKDEQFIRNMDLSTKRANAVAEYIFKTKYNKKYNEHLRKMLVVEGKSFTEPVLVNGKEDYNKSRRVEVKMVVKTADINNFLENFKK